MDDYAYVFISEGPHGKIEKNVVYTYIEENVFNLAFGDWNKKTKMLDDLTRSNNNDMNKILATVALTTLDFTERFPEARIFFEGSTPARTRLYQIGILHNILEINENFTVMGLLDDQ